MDETDQALADFGLARAGQPNEFAVWPEHAQTVVTFAALLTQWRVGPMGGVIGLDYAAIPATLEMMAVDRSGWPELFGQLRVMERAAIEELNGI